MPRGPLLVLGGEVGFMPHLEARTDLPSRSCFFLLLLEREKRGLSSLGCREIPNARQGLVLFDHQRTSLILFFLLGNNAPNGCLSIWTHLAKCIAVLHFRSTSFPKRRFSLCRKRIPYVEWSTAWAEVASSCKTQSRDEVGAFLNLPVDPSGSTNRDKLMEEMGGGGRRAE